MSKMYVKDPDGKYKLVDKQEPQLTLEALDARLKRVEAMFAGQQK